jgi:CBS domain-containing protein
MTQRVIAIHDDASVDEAARLMLQEGITGLPVIDHNKILVGIVTEGDFLRGAGTRPRWLEMMINPGALSLDYAPCHLRRVSDVMTPHPVTVLEDTIVEDVATTMALRDVSRVVVIRGEIILGIINRSNLLHAMVEERSAGVGRKESDLSIRREISADLERLAWMPSASVNPIVRDGVVHLHGCVRHERERDALTFIARSAAGVIRVEDHLVLVEPYPSTTFRRSAGFVPVRSVHAGAA